LALNYYLQSYAQDDTPLLGLYDAGKPNVINISAGRVSDTIPFYKRTWFWGSVAGALGVSAALYIRARTDLPDGQVVKVP
jgi:hypothetical protein